MVRRAATHQQGHARRNRPDLEADRLQEGRSEDRQNRAGLAMNARSIIAALAFALLAGGPPGIAAELDGIRGSTPLTREPRAPALPREVTDDKRQARNYPEQPP